jgi:shikimate kinase
MSPRVVLVGPPGAGKSTVGRILAARWQVEFVDTDHVVEERAGKSVADVFVDEGEPAFRILEEAAVLEALSTSDGVVALGGGAVLSQATREALASHAVALLSTSASAAAARVGMNRDRPLLLGNVRGTLAQLLRDRGPLYDEVADVVITTDDVDAEVVAERVAEALENLT